MRKSSLQNTVRAKAKEQEQKKLNKRVLQNSFKYINYFAIVEGKYSFNLFSFMRGY